MNIYITQTSTIHIKINDENEFNKLMEVRKFRSGGIVRVDPSCCYAE